MTGERSATPRSAGPGGSQYQRRFTQRMAAARAGSESAVVELVEACRKYLLVAAARSLSPEMRVKLAASDLVQETILQAHRSFSQFEGDSPGALLAWTGKILDYKLAGGLRKYRGTRKRDITREIPLGDAIDADPILLEASVDSPSAVAVANEEALRLKHAMEQLRPEHRLVIVLRNWERLSFDEIGKCMARSPDAAYKLWVRALLQLKKHLTPVDE